MDKLQVSYIFFRRRHFRLPELPVLLAGRKFCSPNKDLAFFLCINFLGSSKHRKYNCMLLILYPLVIAIAEYSYCCF